jgi:hypothetical protein
MYNPSLVPGQTGSPNVPARFTGFLAYKNGNRGVWLRGHQHYLENAILADNHIGATFASVESYLTGSLLVGATANTIGTRDLYRGFEYYDGPVGAREVTFVGFDGRGQIPWSALGFNRHNAFSLSTASASRDLIFIRSTPLYIESPDPLKDGDKSAVFQDVTGSVTGVPGRWVTANTPFLTTTACTLQPAWNARSCPGPYLKLIIEGGGAVTAIAPVDAVRDGEATERFVGDGTSTSRIVVRPVTRAAPNGSLDPLGGGTLRGMGLPVDRRGDAADHRRERDLSVARGRLGGGGGGRQWDDLRV